MLDCIDFDGFILDAFSAALIISALNGILLVCSTSTSVCKMAVFLTVFEHSEF